MDNRYTLGHNFNCSFNNKVCAWDNYDYSSPHTNLIKHLERGTKVKVLIKKFPGILVETEEGSHYWVCEWDVH